MLEYDNAHDDEQRGNKSGVRQSKSRPSKSKSTSKSKSRSSRGKTVVTQVRTHTLGSAKNAFFITFEYPRALFASFLARTLGTFSIQLYQIKATLSHTYCMVFTT